MKPPVESATFTSTHFPTGTMIHFDPTTNTFNLVLATSLYAFRADDEGRLLHMAWAPRPVGAPTDLVLGGPGFDSLPRADELPLTRRFELNTFCDSVQQEVALKVTFRDSPIPIRDVRLRYAGHEIVTDAQPGLAPTHGQPTAVSTPRETLRVRLADPAQPLEVTLCYRLTPEHDIIERWVEIANTGAQPIEVEALAFATLHFPNGTTELTSAAGWWTREFTATRERLPMGIRSIEQRSLQTGHYANPFFLLNRPGQAWEETGVVYFGALAYSGAWRIVFEQLFTLDVRCQVGYNPFDFGLTLMPGERHITPAVVIGVCAEGWGGASRRLHAFALERVLPRPADGPAFRPVLYNSWEATYFNLSLEGQIALARKAATIGVELFCVDDGWFGGRRHDRAGLGDWFVSPEVFPEGLEPLIAEVHRLGMQFGLWVEPEMVNPDSELYRAHPDWVLHFPGRPRTEWRFQLMLDFGRREVVEHIYGVLHSLLSRYAIDFLKWDMNRYATEPGSVVGRAIWQAHTAGVYEIMDRLRRAFPHLQIESCASGGGRIDLGILARTDQVWTSDNTDAYDRIRIQEGYSLAYPARAMMAWVTHAVNHQTGMTSPLSLRFDVAMRGSLGIGADLNQLDEAELAEYAQYIAFYKRIRPVVQGGRLYRLQRLEEYGASVIEYVSPDRREAVYSVAVMSYQQGWVRPPAPLCGLDPDAMYSVTDRRGVEVYRAAGLELMTAGIPGDAFGGAAYSRTLYLRQIREPD
ncbi:MAG: alpha-galactosidase [Caldilineales bacterium]|nr:alpha-galactosidase [Caldilineales bacterium]MDW8318883.1 alpha-galactosidase [Anaerolineae bacterium]